MTYFQSYKCIFATRSNHCFLQPFELSSIVSEVLGGPTKARIEFLKILVKWGTREMLRPFLSIGFVDLEESAANAMFPWLRLSYLSKAVKWGNEDTFEYLLNLGACPIRGINYMSRFPWVFPQDTENSQAQIRAMVLKMAEHALRESRIADSHVDGEVLIDHDSFLALLLRTSSLRKYSPQVANQLVERFIDSNVGQIVNSSVLNTYILFVLVLNLPCTLRKFVSRIDADRARDWSTGYPPCMSRAFCPFDSIATQFEGSSVLMKSYPSLDTLSWVSLAIDLALPECLQVLLETWVPSDSTSPVVNNCSEPLEIRRYSKFINVLKQLLAEVDAIQQRRNYPRQVIELYTWPCQIPQRHVEQTEDEHIAKLLKVWIGKLEKVIHVDHDIVDLSDSVGKVRTCSTPKRAKKKQAQVDIITATAQLLQLQVWEMILLIVFCPLSIGFIFCAAVKHVSP